MPDVYWAHAHRVPGLGMAGTWHGRLRTICMVLYNIMVLYTLRQSIDGYVALCDEMLLDASADLLELQGLHDEFPLAQGDAEWLSMALDQAEAEQ